MNEHRKDFYFQLGMLATKFSTIEHYTGEILAKLINSEINVLMEYLVNEMTFGKRIDLITRIENLKQNCTSVQNIKIWQKSGNAN